MKIKKLTIHNIASIIDAEIDFDKAPLANSDVFLIAGKTGAGKTTILDAIALALYGTTPRFENSMMQGSIEENETTVNITAPEQLLRRNTGEGFVTLSFTGKNDVDYEACYLIYRARKNPNGRLQDAKWSLTNLETGHTLTRKKDIENEIKNALNLNFNQFCRTTLLAQGEFSRFLDSKDEDKAEILEKITGMSIYSEIGSKIFDITREKKQNLEIAEAKKLNLTILKPEEIDNIKQEINDITAKISEITNTITADSQKGEWLKREVELNKTAIETAQEHRKALLESQSDDIKQLQTQINTWNLTADARGWLKISEDCDTDSEKARKSLQNLANDFQKVLNCLSGMGSDKEQLRSNIRQCNEFISSVADKIPDFNNFSGIHHLLQSLVEDRKALKNTREHIDKLKESHQSRLTSLALTKSKLDDSNAKLAAKMEEIKKLENQVEASGLPLLREEANVAGEIIGKVNFMIQAVNNLEEIAESLSKGNEKIRNLNVLIANLTKEEENLAKGLSNVQIEENTATKIYESQKDTTNKFAVALRENLNVGDTCPVCRQKIVEKFSDEETLRNIIEGYRVAMEDAVKKRKKTESDYNTLKANISANSQLLETETHTLTQLQKNLELKRLETVKLCSTVKITEITPETPDRLNAIRLQYEESKKCLDNKIKEAEKLTKELDDLRKKVEILRSEADNNQSEYNSLNNIIAAGNSTIETTEASANALIQKILDIESQLKATISGNWPLNWADHPENFDKTFTETRKLYEDRKEELNNLQLKLDKIEAEYRETESLKNRIADSMPEWRDIKESNGQRMENPIHFVSELMANVNAILENLKKLTETKSLNETMLEEFISKNNSFTRQIIKDLSKLSATQINEMNGMVDAVKENLIKAETKVKEIEALIKSHHESKLKLTETDTPELISLRIETANNEIRALSETKGSLKTRLDENDKNLINQAKLLAEIETAKIEHERWSRLNTLLGDKTGKKFKTIAQSYVLANLVDAANCYMNSLSGRYTLRVIPGTFIIAVEDSYQDLTNRAASTLSGGETFLASLSLALALSDIGESLGVNMLFIDEGFGTLSGEPLQKAISTLKTLHARTGKHVGIISHIDELREKIPVKILLEQEANSSASTLSIIG